MWRISLHCFFLIEAPNYVEWKRIKYKSRLQASYKLATREAPVSQAARRLASRLPQHHLQSGHPAERNCKHTALHIPKMAVYIILRCTRLHPPGAADLILPLCVVSFDTASYNNSFSRPLACIAIIYNAPRMKSLLTRACVEWIHARLFLRPSPILDLLALEIECSCTLHQLQKSSFVKTTQLWIRELLLECGKKKRSKSQTWNK